MSRPSKIDRLPPEVREKIQHLREDGHTLDEIMLHLSKMGLDEDGMPSRSGLHRHVQGLDALAEIITQQRATSEALFRVADDPGAPDRSLQLNIQLMHGMMTRLVAETAREQDATISAKEIGFLSRSLQSLASATRSDAVTKLAIRKELAAEMDRKVGEIEHDTEGTTLTPKEVLDRVRALYRGEA